MSPQDTLAGLAASMELHEVQQAREVGEALLSLPHNPQAFRNLDRKVLAQTVEALAADEARRMAQMTQTCTHRTSPN